MKETSSPIDLFVVLDRGQPRSLAVQIEEQIRRAVHAGALKPGTAMPSTRDLARQLAISRGVVVNTYAQLSEEGYLIVRPGSRPRISDAAALIWTAPGVSPPSAPARYDFRLCVPDVSQFPRGAWLRSVRTALQEMSSVDLGYGDRRGVERLRSALAAYLGRARGVVADPECIVVTSGFTQGLGLLCRALVSAGAKRIAFEDPSDPDPREIAARAGLEVVPIGIDEAGLRVEELERADVDAVVVSPAHQHPTGAALAPERRTTLVEWLRRRSAIAIEDDYDAEYRYDRAPVGALQGLEPGRIVYAGSASKTLAPALRIGWLVVPAPLLDAVAHEKVLADRGTARIEQQALGDFIDRRELDRHLRRMRSRYRQRRDAVVAALAESVPEATVQGIAAGLHAAIRLPGGDDEAAILEEGRRRGIVFDSVRPYVFGAGVHPPTILLGYAPASEATIRAGIAELGEVIRATRRS
jgi:GntR family transcriptional regulator/MocR family aminotransferase